MMSSVPPRILLVDADAFFAAVARLVDPEGAGKAPLLIVGGTKESRGVVCSASWEARQYGVRSAMSIARAAKLCPNAMFVPVPGKACSLKNKEIRAVLEKFTPVVEGASIDEWYLDMSGTEAVYHNEPLRDTAHRIRTAVKRETGMSISLGGGNEQSWSPRWRSNAPSPSPGPLAMACTSCHREPKRSSCARSTWPTSRWWARSSRRSLRR
jgi:DNA polymerase-4